VSDITPLASVIVVCWNSADVLGRCLAHLFAQDYPNFEVIVVDDGSEDGTLEVAEAELGTGRLTIVSSPLNRGCPHARNLGLRHAKGEIVAFIDADGFARPSWLRQIAAAFEADATVGGVASTVFLESNPLVLNGAGGIINRQGWAADLAMNVPYESADIALEALYPMGCGMAVRRSAIERVGSFDDHMLNYYDDVDYGIRLWRAGYRVVVAPDAWIDHGFGHSGGDSPRKQLLCEQHRMRVVLTHAPIRTLGRWAIHEALATSRATWPRRDLKWQAMRWNARHLPSTVARRLRMRGAAPMPVALMDPSWGEAFPKGVPPLATPLPERASSKIDMSDADVDQRLSHGWFPMEMIRGRSYRWAGVHAAALIRLEAPARRLRLEYAQVPVDTGGVELLVRRLGTPTPLAPAWRTRLLWQYIERCVEAHPVSLPPGDYEVVFRSREAWSDPPFETRPLGIALASMSFDESFDIGSAELDMSSSSVEEQLVRGWFELEGSDDRGYRWGSSHAAAVIRLGRRADSARISYCLPPGPIGGLKVTVRELGTPRPAWSTRLAWADGSWHEEAFPLRLAEGDYLITFDAEATWSNPDGLDPALGPENRSLGFAISKLSFDAVEAQPER
jgi:GT2 family glycosyltransferase